MLRFSLAFAALSGLVIASGFYGCSQPTTSNGPAAGAPSTTPATAPNGHDEGHADHDHGGHDHGSMEEMKAGLAKLSESDRAAATKQHVCPVSGDMLGKMGAPIKVTVGDQDVWVCCEACQEPLTTDPEKYLAKLEHADHDDHAEHDHDE
ncbi:MAG: hypothetical protein KDA93_18040 [Planctomycetaceae bacterium]|nr:hypothetical protein [Planctomycetaceae bacterium]